MSLPLSHTPRNTGGLKQQTAREALAGATAKNALNQKQGGENTAATAAARAKRCAAMHQHQLNLGLSPHPSKSEGEDTF